MTKNERKQGEKKKSKPYSLYPSEIQHVADRASEVEAEMRATDPTAYFSSSAYLSKLIREDMERQAAKKKKKTHP